MIKSITSHEFNHNFSKYKREAKNGPIFITQRGILCNVLLSIEEYEILIEQRKTIIDFLSMQQGSEIDFEIKELTGNLFNREGLDKCIY